MKIIRDWNKYIQRNKYSECQLITALNAYYYLTGKFIKQDSKRYENLVDLCSARYGSALGIEKIHKKLGLKIKWERNSFLDIIDWRKSKIPLPMEVNIWEKHYGFHSTLIVDHEPKCGAYRITNFRYQTTLDGWIFAENMYQFTFEIRSKKFYSLFGLI